MRSIRHQRIAFPSLFIYAPRDPINCRITIELEDLAYRRPLREIYRRKAQAIAQAHEEDSDDNTEEEDEMEVPSLRKEEEVFREPLQRCSVAKHPGLIVYPVGGYDLIREIDSILVARGVPTGYRFYLVPPDANPEAPPMDLLAPLRPPATPVTLEPATPRS